MIINHYQDTIKKSILLNLLNSSDDDIPITELRKVIEARTGGMYTIVRRDKS